MQRGLLNHPLEYTASVLWWLLVALIVAMLIDIAWDRRDLIADTSRRGKFHRVFLGAFLWLLIILAHTQGVGYSLGHCIVPEFREFQANWFFWCPFHVFGEGHFCGVPLTSPLYIASFAWLVVLAHLIAKAAMAVLVNLRTRFPSERNCEIREVSRQKQ
ncbi:MAG: hypothetical protein ACE5QF_01240 [Thermoplasmata archaeon]